MYDDFLPYALALFNNSINNQKRNKKHKMDSSVVCSADSLRSRRLLFNKFDFLINIKGQQQNGFLSFCCCPILLSNYKFQMFSAYSLTALSAEKIPAFAILTRDIFVNRSLSLYVSETLC